MIGDNVSDMLAAQSSGITNSYLIKNTHNSEIYKYFNTYSSLSKLNENLDLESLPYQRNNPS